MSWEGPTSPDNPDDVNKSLVLGFKSLPLWPHAGHAPGDVTDRMFHSIAQNGFGIDRSQFVWETYKDISYQTCNK